MDTNDSATIRQIIEEWAKAVSSGDRPGILAHHSKQILMYDFPAIERGIEAYDRTWDFFYKDPKGPISFVPSELSVTAGGEVAFATCLIHCDGTSAGPLDLRLTVGLRKIDGEWSILHEHHSVPTTEDRFINIDSPSQA
jgi:ketosteroid isomerase-like protein